MDILTGTANRKELSTATCTHMKKSTKNTKKGMKKNMKEGTGRRRTESHMGMKAGMDMGIATEITAMLTDTPTTIIWTGTRKG
jgi:hypothetical protein